ncbi:hypothetical protein [Paenibacillus silvisoli]|uniref:hypothetical protein n=1 Tax=Paenibacillus silvisoli TaxID=3110539 RepID=UPI002804F3D4|nr:hypothetical protein [Paenibacillus silvisoli]
MKTFLLILGIILFGLGVRGLIVGLVHGSAGSFLLYKQLPDSIELYANNGMILISLVILGLSQNKRRLSAVKERNANE